jgi:sulfur-oxidizing protein SoxZ
MSSIKIRSKRLDGKTQIRTLITHPMENGFNRDKKTNTLIPAHFIHTLTLVHNDKIVATSYMGMSISKDPFFVFMLHGGAVGDTIVIYWEDNLGNNDSETHVMI